MRPIRCYHPPIWRRNEVGANITFAKLHGILQAVMIMGLFFVTVPTLWAHEDEPISTEFALPFERKAGNQKILYEYAREGEGVSDQAIPELELEVGLWPGWQINLGFPLLRIKEGPDEPAIVAGGKLEMGVRRLLWGGGTSNYAVSFQGTIEVPSGNRALFGNTPELSPGIFLDRNFGARFRLHSNLSWITTVGETEEPDREFDYHNALVWFASKRFVPVLELLGATNTDDGETTFAVQPEVILNAHEHLELKAGIPVGLTAASPDIGVRAQISILWGD